MSELIVEPASNVAWSAVETVLRSVGAANHCWCRWWLTTNADYGSLDDDARRDATEAEHEAGSIRGLVATVPGASEGSPRQAVGWVGVGPRADYLRLPRTAIIAKATPDADFADPSIWSIVCFTVAPGHRRSGVAAAMLDAAIGYARVSGARAIEAYPVDTSVGRAPGPGSLNTGTLALFTSAGFAVVGRAKDSRPTVQLPLD